MANRPVDRRREQAAPDPNRWLILVDQVLSVIMKALDTTIINVALPQRGNSLGAAPNGIGWVSTGYIRAVFTVLPITAWLAARFGRKRCLMISVLLFIVASFFCGTSRSLGQLVFWRVLTGGRRRGPALDGPGDLAGDLPAEPAGHGPVHPWAGRRGRAHPSPDAGRLADRQLHLALGVLHQPIHRPGRRRHRGLLPQRLQVRRRPGGGPGGLGGDGAAVNSVKASAGRPRSNMFGKRGAGQLIRQRLDPAAGDLVRHLPGQSGGLGTVAPELRTGHRPTCPEGPEPCGRVLNRHRRLEHLCRQYDPVPPGEPDQ